MATKKHTSITEIDHYSSLSALARADLALEMATEIADRHSQYSTLAGVIVEQLAPPSLGADSPEWGAYRLAQLLDDSMSDIGQMQRLIRCLTVAADASSMAEGGTA